MFFKVCFSYTNSTIYWLCSDMLNYQASFGEFCVCGYPFGGVGWYSGFPSGFSNMVLINLDPQPSGSNQLFLSMFIQAIIGAEWTQNFQDKLI